MVKRIAEISLFIVMFSAAYAAMNYYVYYHVAEVLFPLGNSPLWQVVFVLLALSYPLSQFFKSRYRRRLLVVAGSLWLGMVAISVAVFLLYDFLSLFLPLGHKVWTLVIILALTILGASKAWRGPVVKEVHLQQKRAAPFSIAHLSDLHLGPQTSLKWLEKVIAQVNSLDADIVVITGDLLDDIYDRAARFLPAMQNLRAKNGVYAVSGNHEHYQSIEHFLGFCREAGIVVADGHCLSIAPGVNLLGLGGKISRIDSRTEALIREQLARSGPEDYNILLIHQPVGFRKTAALGIDLQLSGHTHRGQILPMNILIHLVYPYAYGLHALGDSHIYVSSGTGTWGPPLRIGSSSEIVNIKVS